jgi:peptidoglycan biosynthesis protein MviN/MurJ (putative lipid II flippase)
MPDVLKLLLLLVAWIAISAGCHAYIRRYFAASFVAACACVVVLQLASYAELGHPDPFWQVTSVTGFFMAGIVALIVGLPFRIKRVVDSEDA